MIAAFAICRAQYMLVLPPMASMAHIEETVNDEVDALIVKKAATTRDAARSVKGLGRGGPHRQER
eukprot:scaffold667834_cov36-Prasinocladus_malaysianus.AAC.2